MHPDRQLIRDKFAETFGAAIEPAYNEYLARSVEAGPLAVLGYARAGAQPLFLERYLDRPVEELVGTAFDLTVARCNIVELGNLAACNGWAMINLWGRAANDLGGELEYAVATLTAPLRAMFRRVGISLEVLAPADRARAGGEEWGSYYDTDPLVCVGRIAQGQQAIARFLARRAVRIAA